MVHVFSYFLETFGAKRIHSLRSTVSVFTMTDMRNFDDCIEIMLACTMIINARRREIILRYFLETFGLKLVSTSGLVLGY